ncbi:MULTISPECIES: DNA cytosine methyltransferase [unclassified Massilia]|uniref:DNA cytosine methyltransferase n=1 Tax=unclassified Massilia TaxID=2609279 RepID=UPI00178695D6|nr:MULTISPECIES: DNA cytosine methyltransferase [unclassified Massilia]MBD8531461.1 DNA cytosine methyltransferase [Massilia sp. CFBP 13647]MBD8673743.1 DNA cytosine methyltransferase [Massilia sp. CFBP 13721]
MKRDAFTFDLGFGPERIADNFAGGGGASEAIRQAFGRDPDIAINHDGEALAMHAANHPTTRHLTEDVFLVDPLRELGDGPLGAVWFSPTCTHFSKAKGFNILDQKTRGLAWVTYKWGVLLAPRLMFLENVEEFQGWGPLDDHGRPIKALKGRTFEAFVLGLTTGLPKDHPDLPEIVKTLGPDFPVERIIAGLGYKVEWRVLRACDFGAGTIRKRLFMVMRRDGIAIRWPEPTHGDPNSLGVKSGKLLPFVTAADCIDWSIPCRSIFDRKKPLAEATLRRVGRGFERYVKNAARPYIVGAGGPAYAGKPATIDKPIGTLTTENHRSVVVPHVTKFYGGSTGHACDEPLATITSGAGAARPAGAAHSLGLVTASLVQYYKSGSQNVPADRPMPTIVTKDRVGVTCAYLAKHYKGVIGASVEQPTPTVTTSDHTSLITAHLVGIDNQSNGARDTWDVAQPLNTIVTENRHAVVTSNLVKLRGTSTAAAVDAPLGAITAGGQHHAEMRTTLAHPGHTAARRELIRAFLRAYCPSLKDAEFPELVTIDGVVYEVVDIGLRMLVPRELANAQGFPRSYILDPFFTKICKRGRTVTRRLSGSAQVRMIGNSVAPPPAVAVIRANIAYEAELTRLAA